MKLKGKALAEQLESDIAGLLCHIDYLTDRIEELEARCCNYAEEADYWRYKALAVSQFYRRP